MSNPNPTGAVMLARGVTVKARVKEILIEIPQTKGDDLLLIYHYWRRHDFIRISFSKFKDLIYATSPESIRRRRQELQHDNAELRATERVVHKRERNEEAHRHYYGNGTRLTDYVGEA
jgi:hypothetical protein